MGDNYLGSDVEEVKIGPEMWSEGRWWGGAWGAGLRGGKPGTGTPNYRYQYHLKKKKGKIIRIKSNNSWQ